jgi:hypothetical protein
MALKRENSNTANLSLNKQCRIAQNENNSQGELFFSASSLYLILCGGNMTRLRPKFKTNPQTILQKRQ